MATLSVHVQQSSDLPSGERTSPATPNGTEDQDIHSDDPLAAFLADPESHLSDLLYLNFRIYKKRVLFRLLKQALSSSKLDTADRLAILDVGASMGFDVLFLLRRLSENFKRALPSREVHLTLLEGDQTLIDRGQKALSKNLRATGVDFEYYHHPLVEKFPLADSSHEIALCSEVVEHLEHPDKVFGEIHRVLKPGGFLLLTTDNSPNVFQMLRRVPVWLTGRYKEVYARPSLESETVGYTLFQSHRYPIYGHINLNPTWVWEKTATAAGFHIAGYGSYESIRRGGGKRTPLAMAFYFLVGALVHYLLPRRIGRFFGDTTALLLQKPTNGA